MDSPDLPPSDEVGLASSSLGRWARDEPLQAATAAGLLLYASFRLDFVLFYGRFAITPEEVGITYVSTLAQAVVGSAVAFSAVFVIVFVFVQVARFFLRELRSLTKAFVHSWGVLWAIALWTAVVSSLTLSAIVLREIYRNPFAVAVLMIILSVVTTAGLLYTVAIAGIEYSVISSKPLAAPAVPVGTGVAILVFFVLLPVSAYLDAQAVKRGESRKAQFAGILSLPWGASATFVRDSGDPGSRGTEVSSGDCVMYLGRSTSAIIYWDLDANELLRVPPDDVVLATNPDDESCPG